MALIIETGSIVANANTYNGTADLIAYATQRNLTDIAEEDAEVLEALLIKAMDKLERYRFKGDYVDVTQPLEWPRSGVVTRRGELPSNAIPNDIKAAQLELAIISYSTDLTPTIAPSAAIDSVKVGSITVDYANPEQVTPILTKVDMMLDQYVVQQSFRIARV